MTQSDPTRHYLAAAQAEDTNDLLSHIAWTDVILPELISTRDKLTTLLVGATLGQPITERGPDGTTTPVSKEQIAGKIYGINMIIALLTQILKRGKSSVEALRAYGVSISSTLT